MAVKSFQEIIAWQKARVLTINVYDSMKDCRDYGFRDQLQRASLSIMNNIAEGYAKQSNKSFLNFLSIAKGSAAEVESMLLIAPSLGYISEVKQEELLAQVNEVSRLLAGFMNSLRT